MFRYRLMKVRSKISYHAFRNNMTINELMLTQILKSFEELKESRSIPRYPEYSSQLVDDMANAIGADMSSCIMAMFEINKNPQIRQRKNILYRGREMQALGYRNVDDMPPKLRKGFERLISENLFHATWSPTRPVGSPEGIASYASLGDGVAGLFLDKGKCENVFEYTTVDGMSMYEKRSAVFKLKNKFDRQVIDAQLSNVKFMLNCGELVDIFFIQSSLKRISLIRQKFVLELEQGQETYIPNTLSLDSYPMSMRYYDPLLMASNNLFSPESKQYHQLRTEFNIRKIQRENWLKYYLICFGILEDPKEKKLVQAHSLINEADKTVLKHTDTPHTMSLQKSRYLRVESGLDQLRHLAMMQEFQTSMPEEFPASSIVTQSYKSLEDKDLNLRFCQDKEVRMKRQKFVKFKQTFYQRHDHMKKNG